MKKHIVRILVIVSAISILTLSNLLLAHVGKQYNTYDIQTALTVNGKLIATPRIITSANEKAVIRFTQNNKPVKIQVLANTVSKNIVDLKYTIHMNEKTYKPQLRLSLNKSGKSVS